MKMVRHQAVDMARQRKPIEHPLKQSNPRDAIGIVSGDRDSIDPSRVRMKESGFGERRSGVACHVATISGNSIRHCAFSGTGQGTVPETWLEARGCAKPALVCARGEDVCDL